MFTEEYLRSYITVRNIGCYNVSVTKDSFKEHLLLLNSNTIDELANIVKGNNISSVFYSFSYYDKDSYIVNEDTMEDYNGEFGANFDSEFSKDVYSLLSRDIKSCNKQIEEIDFSRPAEVCVFCIYEANYIAIQDYDLWSDTLHTYRWQVLRLLESIADTLIQALCFIVFYPEG